MKKIRGGICLLLCLALLMPAVSLEAATSLSEERRIAREALAQVLDEIPLVNDPDSVDYLRALGDRLVRQLDNNLFTYHFWLVDVQVLNAFALPAGYIFMFSGMFTALESEDELAGILAHEIAHSHMHHVVRRLDKSEGAQKLSLVGMLVGALLGALGGGALAGAAILGSVAGGVQSQIAFTREYEEEADYYGFLLMTKANFAGEGMVKSFGRLWQQERITGGSSIPDYLRTHPASAARMERMEAMLARRPQESIHTNNHEFLRIKTRLQALYSNSADAYDFFRSQVRQYPDSYLANYGLALVEIRQGNYAQAQSIMPKLYTLWPDGKSFVDKLQADIYSLSGDYSAAARIYQQVVTRRPADREALSGLAENQIRLNMFTDAIGNLDKVLHINPQDDEARYNLGMALGRLGRQDEASAQLGMAFFQRKNANAATYHLQRASQNLPEGSELREQAEQALERMGDRDMGKDERRIRQEERLDENKARVWRSVPPPPWHGES